jgi:hypothetical protein
MFGCRFVLLNAFVLQIIFLLLRESLFTTKAQTCLTADREHEEKMLRILHKASGASLPTCDLASLVIVKSQKVENHISKNHISNFQQSIIHYMNCIILIQEIQERYFF